jgi:hypothetical protein
MEQLDSPYQDQWTYHAIADIILANSLLRSFPEVDPDRIGLTGVSWGGYLTCIASGVDNRFKFAVPVYGCGFLGEDSAWVPEFKQMGKERSELWLKQWDPAEYLKNTRIPIMWVTGTNDAAYFMDSLQKSYQLPLGPKTLHVTIKMPHGHGGYSENPPEIHALADSYCLGTTPLLRVTGHGAKGDNAWVTYRSKTALKRAELIYTKDTGNWPERNWESTPASIVNGHRVTADVPAGTKAYYMNMIDDRDLIVSSEYTVIP